MQYKNLTGRILEGGTSDQSEADPAARDDPAAAAKTQAHVKNNMLPYFRDEIYGSMSELKVFR